jgi:hypothetical protein
MANLLSFAIVNHNFSRVGNPPVSLLSPDLVSGVTIRLEEVFGSHNA